MDWLGASTNELLPEDMMLPASSVLESMRSFLPPAGVADALLEPSGAAAAGRAWAHTPAAHTPPATPPDSDADPAELFRRAQELVALAEQRARDAESTRLAALAAGVADAQTRLVAQLRRDLGPRVLEAAALGNRTAELLAFHGPDRMPGVTEHADEYSYLYLVRGPRERAHREELRGLGLAPLLPRLRRELYPFTVRHTWNEATNLNAIAVDW